MEIKMKLTKTQRSQIAERICARWLKRRGIAMRRAPKVYVIVHQQAGAAVWGVCHLSRGFITLHVGPKANRRDKYILLAHEFAHYLHYLLDGRVGRRWNALPHGERFQRLLWRVIPIGLWKRASTGRWVVGPAAHRPQFQPDRQHEMAA
jgi:hypothetical protein